MRLFLAAGLPPDLSRSVERLRGELSARVGGWRWVRAEGVHLTLRFLGEVSAERDRRARGSWRRAAVAAEPFRIRLAGLGRFPARGRPRVVWLGVEEVGPGGVLAALAAELEGAARRLGWEPETRPFRPHLTLGRARRGARAENPPELAVGEEGVVDQVVLYRSRLDATGARYTALESFPLGRPAQGDGADER